MTIQPGGPNKAHFASPGPEVIDGTLLDPALNLPGPHAFSMQIVSGDVEVAEALYWKGWLIASERTALISYANTKYGALPHA